MKKLFKLPILAATALSLGSCNLIQAGKIEEIAGTYILEEYNITHYYEGSEMTEVEEPETKDYIKDLGIVCYVVITESGMGYYGYKDNDTAAYVTEVKQTYEYDTDEDAEPEMIEKITLDDGALGNEWLLYVQARRKTFTNNKSAWKTTLHLGKHTVPIGENDKIQIKYKKVSKRQDKKILDKKLKGYTFNAYSLPVIVE